MRDSSPSNRNVGRRYVALWISLAAGGLATIAALYFVGIPVLAGWVAHQVPVAWEEELGERVTGALVGGRHVHNNASEQRALDAVVSRLSDAAEPHPYRFRVSVVDNPDVNAFAAPGGAIVVFSGLIREAESPDELAGVLAHEMEHVLQRHGTRILVQQLSVAALMSLATGGDSALADAMLEHAEVLGTLGYSRRFERSADRAAIELLRRAEIQPDGLARFLRSIERDDQAPGALSYLSTHPATKERISALSALIPSTDAAFTPALTDEEWKAVHHSYVVP